MYPLDRLYFCGQRDRFPVVRRRNIDDAYRRGPQVVDPYFDLASGFRGDVHRKTVGPVSEIEVFIDGVIFVLYAAQFFVIRCAEAYPRISPQQTRPFRPGFVECVQRIAGSLRGHFHFVDASVFVECDRFHTGFAHRPSAVRRPVVEYVPLSVELADRAVVVPRFGIASGVIDDYAAVFERSERRFRRRIADAGRTSFAQVSVNHVIDSVALAHTAAFVEKVIFFSDQSVYYRRSVHFQHVVFQFGPFGRELPPVEVRLSVVVDEDRRVDLRNTFHRLTVFERSVGRVRYCHAFVDRVPHTVI